MQRVLEFTQNLYRVLSLDSAHKPSIVGPRARGLQTLEPFGIRSGIFWYLYFGTVARWPLTRARQSHRLWWASRFPHCSKTQLARETRFGPVAQRIEQQPSKLKVAGSSPAGVATFSDKWLLALRQKGERRFSSWGGAGWWIVIFFAPAKRSK